MTTIDEFYEKLASGHIFKHRYLVTIPSEPKMGGFASGDTPEEAIEDQRRLYRKMGLHQFAELEMIAELSPLGDGIDDDRAATPSQDSVKGRKG